MSAEIARIEPPPPDDEDETRSGSSGCSAPPEGGSPLGAELLDKVEATVTRYVAFPSEHHAPVVTAWIAHAHLIDAFDSTPRLAVLSPEKGSGKSRLLEILEPLLPMADVMLAPSPAVLFRSIDAADGYYCLLLDECDATLGLKRLSEDQEQVRAIVNAGYRRGATVARAELVAGKQWEPRKFKVFAPVALAGIGDLPDTILDRSVVIAMKRRRPQDTVQPWRTRMAATLEPLRDSLINWAQDNQERAIELDSDPHFLPEGVEDRRADVWGPLIISAALAGDRWHHKVTDAAAALMGEHSERAASIGVRLLADIRQVFTSKSATQMATAELLEGLHKLEGAPWGDLRGAPIDARFLARKLVTYDVHPRALNLGGEARPRGYSLRPDTDGNGGLGDAFTRYLPSLPEGSATSATTATERNQ